MAPGGLRTEHGAARAEPRGPPRSLGDDDAEPGSMAAAGQEEDQDQDAVGGQKTIYHTFLPLSQITALSEQNVEGFQKTLAEFLNFKQLMTSLKEAILLDYYTAGFCWAKEMNFSVTQLSQFMDLLNFLLENLRDKHMTLEDNIKELGRAMAGIGETDSERSGDLHVFSIDQAKAIIDYMNISLFRVYKLYERIFHSPREEHVISNESHSGKLFNLSNHQDDPYLDLCRVYFDRYMVELAPPAVTPFPALPEDGTSSDIYASLLASPIAAHVESKGSDQEGLLGEPSPEEESFEAHAVAGFTGEDQKPTVLLNPK